MISSPEYPSLNVRIEEFLHTAKALLQGSIFDVQAARDILPPPAMTPHTRPVVAKLLTEIVSSGEESTHNLMLQNDARYLAVYLKDAILMSMDELLLDDEEVFDEKFYAQKAFNEMHTYTEPAHQGLEFTRIFMRNALEAAAKKIASFKPNYDSLHLLLSNLLNRPHAKVPHSMFLAMIEMPENVNLFEELYHRIMYLQQYCGEYEKLKEANARFSVPKFLTLKMLFINVSEQLLLFTPWRSQNFAFYEKVWSQHQILRSEQGLLDERKEILFLQSMLACGPGQVSLALQHLHGLEHTRLSQIEALFPLSFMNCNAERTLAAIVQILYGASQQKDEDKRADLQYQKSIVFGECLKAHHPDFWEILQQYSQLYLGSDDLLTSASSMVSAFEQLYSASTHEYIEFPADFCSIDGEG